MNDDDMRIENEKAMCIYVCDKLETGIEKLIAKMLDWKRVRDAPQRVGDCSLTNCYERYKRMSGSGMLYTVCLGSTIFFYFHFYA